MLFFCHSFFFETIQRHPTRLESFGSRGLVLKAMASTGVIAVAFVASAGFAKLRAWICTPSKEFAGDIRIRPAWFGLKVEGSMGEGQ